MSRFLFVVVALSSVPLAAAPEPPRAEGRIESGEARVEILGRSYRVGETIELPEGYLRVEEAGPEDEEVGSFTVVPAATFASETPSAPHVTSGPDSVEAREPVAVATAGRRAPCRAERAAYLAEIWKQSGIEVSNPAAFLDAFEGSSGNQNIASLWFVLSTDAFRTLAWSSDARSKANALARCMAAR